MKWIKISVITLVVLVLIAGAGALTYRTMFAQKVIESYNMNRADASSRVVIATQGSSFKDSIMSEVVEYFKGKDIYIEVIDVTSLNQVNSDSWDFIQILSTIESGKPSEEVNDFISSQGEDVKFAVLFTAGSGKYDYPDKEVDAVTSASRDENHSFIELQ